MEPGTCRCDAEHEWRALVVEYGDVEGILVSHPRCPTCDKLYEVAVTGFPREALEDYCKRWGDDIFVRAQIDGHFESTPLSKLSEEHRRTQIDVWFGRHHIPVRVLKEPRE